MNLKSGTHLIGLQCRMASLQRFELLEHCSNIAALKNRCCKSPRWTSFWPKIVNSVYTIVSRIHVDAVLPKRYE